MNVVKLGQSHTRLLQSDIHVGSAETDYKLIDEELQWAKDHKAPVWINGDLFDAIIPRDKRYEPSTYHKRLHGKNDVIGEQIKWAVEIYNGSNVEFVGWGNHDHDILRYHGFDPVEAFIKELGRGVHGAYSGYIKCPDMKVYYHHGAGGGSSITGALGACDRKLSHIDGDTDIVWMGHRHWQTFGKARRVVTKGEKVSYRDIRLITTGAYLDTMNNSQASYGEKRDYRPQGKGGVKLFGKGVYFD